MVRKKQGTNEVIKALQVLALNCNHEDYKEVAGVMFRLYMGQKFDYGETFDNQFLSDIQAVWQHTRPKKAKKLKFKLVKGGMDGK